ncbi:ABC transporter B family member 15-like [Senna tora]|uniref:ABC transporter B family member 15-like n=1 Tax=Senna tora TaxID=362788 RepID=A0A834SI18_9FABA|nr:ABC transporter B family member 15-like [Senna tora]
MRARYLKAVLRQEVAYFDLHVTSTSEVIITSVSNDTILIQEQDVLSEKLHRSICNAMEASHRGLPFRGFPGNPRFNLIYCRTLMGLAGKIRDDYDRAGTIAEQAISSIRIVYSFVGETDTVSDFSSALQASVKLGLKQGLAIGSNGIVFAIWSFMCYYGSRLVMYHRAQGGTVFAVGAAIAVGGLRRVVQREVPLRGQHSRGTHKGDDKESPHDRFREHGRRNSRDNPRRSGIPSHTLLLPVKTRKHRSAGFFPESTSGENNCAGGGEWVGKIHGDNAIAEILRAGWWGDTGGWGSGSEVAARWLRSQMGLVSQEPVLFGTTVKENILFGKEDATEEEVLEAALASNAHDFVSHLPMGYDTQCVSQVSTIVYSL